MFNAVYLLGDDLILRVPRDDPHFVAALDFSGMPLRAVPDVLAGYRELATLPDDETVEARILRYHLHFALVNVRNTPQPLRSWGERPLGYLLDLMRFLLDAPGSRWAELRP